MGTKRDAPASSHKGGDALCFAQGDGLPAAVAHTSVHSLLLPYWSGDQPSAGCRCTESLVNAFC